MPKMDGIKAAAKKADSLKSGNRKQEFKAKGNSRQNMNKSKYFAAAAAIIIAAAAAGGSYFWQKKETAKTIAKISADARATRLEFEKRIDNLREQISSLKKNEEKLKESNKELKKQTEELSSAQKRYNNSELGLSFYYPASFGEISIEAEDGKSGKAIIGSFSLNPKLFFGAVTVDYEPSEERAEIKFIESRGYKQERGEYYFMPPGGNNYKDYKLSPAKIIESRTGKVLLVDKKSFNIKAKAKKVDIGENAGLLANLKKKEYSGIAFLNEDFGMLPLEKFVEMAESIEVR